MNHGIFFATFNPFSINAPQSCRLRITRPPAFNYEYWVQPADGKPHSIKGFCCTACATGLPEKLAGKDTEKAADKTGGAIKKGVKGVGHDVKKGTEKTADTLK